MNPIFNFLAENERARINTQYALNKLQILLNSKWMGIELFARDHSIDQIRIGVTV